MCGYYPENGKENFFLVNSRHIASNLYETLWLKLECEVKNDISKKDYFMFFAAFYFWLRWKLAVLKRNKAEADMEILQKYSFTSLIFSLDSKYAAAHNCIEKYIVYNHM